MIKHIYRFDQTTQYSCPFTDIDTMCEGANKITAKKQEAVVPAPAGLQHLVKLHKSSVHDIVKTTPYSYSHKGLTGEGHTSRICNNSANNASTCPLKKKCGESDPTSDEYGPAPHKINFDHPHEDPVIVKVPGASTKLSHRYLIS